MFTGDNLSFANFTIGSISFSPSSAGSYHRTPTKTFAFASEKKAMHLPK
jgi:hypothetical protein